MRPIAIDFRNSALAGVPSGEVRFRVSRRFHVDGPDDYIVLPQPVTAKIENGMGRIELEPDQGRFCWVAEERVGPGSVTRFVSVPVGTTLIEYGDLQDVNPANYEPVSPILPGPMDILTQAEQARDAAQAVAAGLPAAAEVAIAAEAESQLAPILADAAAQAATAQGAANDAVEAAALAGSIVSAAPSTLLSAAKNPDTIVAGTVTGSPLTSAQVVWPDSTPGVLTIDARHSTGAVNGYHITYGSPVTKTFTQPTITRATDGAPTNVPQIVVS